MRNAERSKARPHTSGIGEEEIMAISKKTREIVYEKYGRRCAYCGREIAYKDMQVDHFYPQSNFTFENPDRLGNLMPSCRMCNHYKRAHSLETFRSYIEEIPRKLRQNYIYKVGLVYENVIEEVKPIRFYFEKCDGIEPEEIKNVNDYLKRINRE